MIPAPVRELGSGPPFPKGGGPSAPTSGEPDWRSLFERERRRAEEWRRGEIDWRAKARSWRRQFEIGRDKLAAARAEAREVRRAAREALSLRAEVGRLKRLLAAAGVDARKRSTIVSLRMEVETRRTRIGELEAELAKLRASRAVHAKARFGRKSERRERAGSDRPRGQQAGAAGHGRTPRPGLEKRAEVHNPAADERVCSDCGKPYVANGSDTSELIEVSVKAHTRVIERPRGRPRLRLRRRAAGSLGAAGGAPVREHALRDQRVGAVPVRAPCVSSAPQPGRRLADRPGAGDLGGDAGRRRAAPRAAVRAALGGHPGAPSARRGCARATRRPGASGRSARPAGRAAPGCGSGSAGRGPLPCRSLARRRGGGEAVRRRRPGHVLVCGRYSAYKKLAKDSAGLVTLAFCWAYVAARIMLRRVPKVALDMSSLETSAT